jgi:hypothetical protein
VALAGSERGSEAHDSDDDDDDRIGVAEVEEASADLREEEEHSDGDNNNRAHETANGAALAIATDAITHIDNLPKEPPRAYVPCGS